MQEKILVVDDDPAIIRIVQMILEKCGYAVTSTTTGEEAFQIAFALQPDLIILDVNMPGGWSGFETCKKFKATPDLAPIPIIFLTAKVEQFEEGFDLGGADYVLKPFNQKELIARTQFHLKMRRLVKQVQQVNDSLEHKVQARTQDLTNSNNKLSQVINERKLLESRLKHEVGQDFLTHLPSGTAFESELQAWLDAGNIATHPGALLFLDLAKFEAINQRYGWDAGDDILINVSNLLQSQLGAAALIGRPGGDQFAIYLKNATTSSAKTIARGLIDCISSFPFTWQASTIQAGVCIGFCCVDSQELSARKILSKAIQAMVIAKDGGIGTIVDYQDHATAQDAVEEGENWIRQIEQALESNDFSLFYQQVKPLSSSSKVRPSLEILLRLNAKISERFILPSEIFGFSGINKIKSKIDFWVLKEALNWLHTNQSVMQQFSHVSLNLTSETIANPMFLLTLENLLESNSIEPSFLCFEISEPDALFSIDRTRAFLGRLQSLGCLTCIDDFGGQSSIHQHLQQLNVNFVKIDGAFVRHLTDNPVNVVLCKMLKEVSEITGTTIVAKHVEEQVVATNLIELGIDYAQGHLFHKPEPLNNLIK
jgi:diguanylate cyclase (GGDEF)-like protein